ncbi:MAG: T9SS type A sorting domain-containing protein [Bacteroidales bacterium]|nr:T9SS type A sorting domain-containing protein [Bacteroidales bacterium]
MKTIPQKILICLLPIIGLGKAVGQSPESFCKFPAGKDVIIEQPICKEEKTTIKVPYKDTTKYTLTIVSADDGTGENIITDSLQTETINGTTYYVVSEHFTAGAKTLKISSPGTGCYLEKSFKVPDIPAFTIDTGGYFPVGGSGGLFGGTERRPLFPNKIDDFEIRKYDSTGGVNLQVSGSYDLQVTIIATKSSKPSDSFTKTLPPVFVLPVDPDEHVYSFGGVNIDLYAGIYEVLATNAHGCNSNTLTITLRQPERINYNTTVQNPKCTGNESVMKISNIRGGIRDLQYSIDNDTAQTFNVETITINGLSSGLHTVTIKDNFGNATTEDVSIPAAPLAITLATVITPPTICNGNDGKIKVKASGGTPPFRYSKDNMSYSDATSDTFTLTSLESGTITIYVRDSNNCSANFNTSVPEGRRITVTSIDAIAPTCYGEADGKCVLVTSNRKGTLSTNYLSGYSVSGDTITFNDLTTNNYSFTITERYKEKTCSINVNFDIPQKDNISIDTLVTRVSDKGTASGKIDINIAGGNGQYKIFLFDGTDTLTQINTTTSHVFDNLTGSSANNGKLYTIEAVDVKGCSNRIDVRVLEPRDTLKLTATLSKPVSCHNDIDATVKISADGGWSDNRYSKDGNTWDTTTIFSSLSGGNYTYYVKDQYGGTASTSITVENPQPLSIIADSIENVDCHDAATGFIRFKVSGGTKPYSYTMSPNIGTAQNGAYSGLTADNYSFTVTDTHNCRLQADTVTISQPEPLQLSVSDIVHPTCGWENGHLTATASGGTSPYTYTLTTADNTTILKTETSNTSVLFDNIPEDNTYRLSVIDNNGCTTQDTLIIFIEYINPWINTLTVSNVICFGENNGRIIATSEKGSYFTLTNDENGDTTRSDNGVFTGLTAGNYTIYVFDTNNCQSENALRKSVEQPDKLGIEIVSTTPVINKGAKDGKILFTTIGGNDGSVKVYLKNAENEIIDSLSTASQQETYFSVRAGSYTLEVIDSKKCTYISETVQVDEPADSLKLIVTEVKNALCKSQTGGITVEGVGGWGDYRYKRAINESYMNQNSFDGLTSGTYLITVIDAKGATASRSITVYEPQDSLRAEITSTQSPTCITNGTVSIALFGGTAPYRLFYDNRSDTIFANSTATVQWTAATSSAFVLHIADANGCKFKVETSLVDTNSVRIESFVTDQPTVPHGATGSIEAKIVGSKTNLTFVWKKTGTNEVFPNSASITGLSSGNYILKVRDEDGCETTASVYLPDPSDRFIKALEVGDETSYNAKNGYAILYADSGLEEIRLINPHNTHVDHPEYTNSFDFWVGNDTIYAKGLEGGHWLVIATYMKEQSAVASFDIAPYLEFKFGKITLLPALTPNGTDGSAVVEVLGGAGSNTFVWTNIQGDTMSSTNSEYITSLSNLSAGKYILAVTDKYNNIISTTIEILAPAQALQINISERKHQSCNGMEDAYIILSAVGGWGDYHFAHTRQIQDSNRIHQTDRIFSNLATGDHYFHVVDRHGKTAQLNMTITEPDLLRASVTEVKHVSCTKGLNGAVTFDISGGNTSYYLKEKGTDIWKAGNVATRLAAGEHIFEFTDNLQCISPDTLSVIITEPDSLLFQSIDVTHTICGEDNGVAVVALNGGTHPYTYIWKDGENNIVGTDSAINNLKPTAWYRLFVTDKNGCTQYWEQLIQGSIPPRITNVERTTVLCYGDNTGAARITSAEAGNPFAPYSFEWSGGETDTFVQNLVAGQYYVTAKDTNNCSTTYYFDITQPDSLYLLITDSKEPHCFEYSDGWINTETHGGAGDYTYLWSNGLWSNGATTTNIDNLPKGSYQVRVTDKNGCSFENQLTLNEPDYQSIDLGEDVIMCIGNTYVVDGGDYKSYRWFTDSEDSIFAERYLSVTEAGRYYLEAKMPDDCSAWGDISVDVGNSLLQADMLVPSEATVGDTLYVFEISNILVDTVVWEYDSAAFARLYTDDGYNMSYVLLLQCKTAGVHNIHLSAYSGNCYSPVSKQVEVLVMSDSLAEDEWGIQPMIKKLTVFPNPAIGDFTAEIELREVAAVDLKLFDLVSGMIVHQRTATGLNLYNVNYKSNGLRKGAYVLIATVGKERRQAKIIIQ